MCKSNFYHVKMAVLFSLKMFEREFCSNSSFACGLFHLNGADLYFNAKHIDFFKWNLVVRNFAHHLPIVANNSQSSDYGLCHNIQLKSNKTEDSDLCPDIVIMKDCHFEDD